ncbi:MAG TPA: aspartate dehydrogenase, partial [Candidatus Methanofastidiosa archaeon]|nr:aspartate dehydrogenase [Candidatus Methanofastidiosa archaeon]
LLGCGNIARIISKYDGEIVVKAVYDKDGGKSRSFSHEFKVKNCMSMEELLSVDSDIVVEAASPLAVRAVAMDVIRSGKDMMIMSVGGLSDVKFRNELLKTAKELHRKIYIPSGAIGGLDALSSTMVGRLDGVVLETTKPPGALGMDVKERTVVFEGSPKEAIERYPKNINVSVTLAVFAGNDKVKVRIVADPDAKRNTHSITITGEIGVLSFVFDNEPSPNMSTSLLAGYSAIAVLKKIDSPLQF